MGTGGLLIKLKKKIFGNLMLKGVNREVPAVESIKFFL